MNKDAIRKEILSLRNNMDARMVLEYSSIIQNRLMELDLYKESRVIFTYMSFKNEVETRDLICQALKKNKRVVIPVCRKADRSIIPSEIFDLNQLEENFYGI